MKRKLSKAGQKAFLAAYCELGNIKRAAQAAKIDRTMHYDWLRLDPDYPERFASAHEVACETLEAEARRRAVEGVFEPLVHQGEFTFPPLMNADGTVKKNKDGAIQFGKTPLGIQKFSDTLLIFLLKGAKPDRYRDSWKGELSIPGGLNLRAKVDLSNLTDEQLQVLESLADAAVRPSSNPSGETEAKT